MDDEGRRRAAAAALAALVAWVVLGTAVAGAVDREPTYDGTGPVRTTEITTEAGDRYLFTAGPARMRVEAAPGNVGSNLRAAWWPEAAPPTVDAETCFTWTGSEGPLVQPGLVLRLRRDGARQRVITVTNNVWFGARWHWNVHVWETGQPLQRVGSVPTPAIGGEADGVVPLPWRACARTVGAAVEIKVWPAAGAEPAWGDPGHGGTVALPPGWVFPGHAGWYVGHLGPDGWLEVDDLATWRLLGTPGEEHMAAISDWAGALYPLVFGRPADEGRSFWADQALARSPEWAVAAMGTTPEARALTIAGVYHRVLRRAPDPDGLRYWADRLLTHPNVEGVTLAVVLSPELSGARDDRAFVAVLYERLLGRAADRAGADFWVGELARGRSRSSVASWFVRSPENRASTVTATHVEVLGRSPDATEADHWGRRFVALGLDRLRLRAAMAASLVPPPPAPRPG